MPRELKPCGTPAAARRHRRNGEELCDECRHAVRAEKSGRYRAERDEKIAAFHESVDEVDPVVDPGSDEVDPLQEAMDSLALIRRALHSDQTMPRDIGPLTRRRDELVDRIQELKKSAEPAEVSVFDELEQKREASRNRNTG